MLKMSALPVAPRGIAGEHRGKTCKPAVPFSRAVLLLGSQTVRAITERAVKPTAGLPRSPYHGACTRRPLPNAIDKLRHKAPYRPSTSRPTQRHTHTCVNSHEWLWQSVSATLLQLPSLWRSLANLDNTTHGKPAGPLHIEPVVIVCCTRTRPNSRHCTTHFSRDSSALDPVRETPMQSSLFRLDAAPCPLCSAWPSGQGSSCRASFPSDMRMPPSQRAWLRMRAQVPKRAAHHSSRMDACGSVPLSVRHGAASSHA